ncbi:Peroxisomal membrane (Mpv17/PMP22) family protein [Thalictrum thalictroides]|uniref:Peroxisomal membrane (Mpv17/PMP22) family protein n=1 Tax=Thalictrum thalictroides TaxID=46969 RepID=A0A7J6VA64_THATH|nr:Peroxisomal membrane (Mpv17/PMP22) family protein [Thalictrum thalictroides]
MASVNNFTTPRFLSLSNPINESKQPKFNFPSKGISSSSSSIHHLRNSSKLSKLTFLTEKRSYWVVGSVKEDLDAIEVKLNDSLEQLDGDVVQIKNEREGGQVGEHQEFSASSSSSLSVNSDEKVVENDEISEAMNRTINAGIILAAGTFAITRLLTIDHDYWQGWTLYEILRYAPEHNWIAYEEALKTNPVLSKMVISGVVYSLGDWIAQCYEGKPLFEFDRVRALRSGLVGFALHGSLSHYYYQFCEALIPFNDWWVVPAKVAFDQTIWAAIWNSIYFVALGLLRLDTPANIFDELKATFLPMLTAGWKLWPFAHLITYGAIPLEQRLLWVDCVELIWVTILSTYSNEKSEARISEASLEANSESSSTSSSEK